MQEEASVGCWPSLPLDATESWRFLITAWAEDWKIKPPENFQKIIRFVKKMEEASRGVLTGSATECNWERGATRASSQQLQVSFMWPTQITLLAPLDLTKQITHQLGAVLSFSDTSSEILNIQLYIFDLSRA